jgi:hypothetical protein
VTALIQNGQNDARNQNQEYRSDPHLPLSQRAV